jgi:hypothetical protein
MFFVGVQLLQKYGYVSTINWDKLGNDTSTQIQHWATNTDTTNLHGILRINYLIQGLGTYLVYKWGVNQETIYIYIES